VNSSTDESVEFVSVLYHFIYILVSDNALHLSKGFPHKQDKF